MKVTGVVEKTAREGKAIMIDGVWYGALKASQTKGAGEGEEVTFSFKKAGKYNNIEGNVEVVGSGGGSGSGSSSRGETQLNIMRQNALNNAVHLYSAFRKTDEDMPELINVLRTANQFLSYTTGEFNPDLEDLPE